MADQTCLQCAFFKRGYRLAKAVEGLNDQALFLEQSHAARMVSIGRDPAKYASDLSMMAHRVRELIKEIDNG